MTAHDLTDPAARERLLESIPPEAAPAHHQLLRDVFTAEMAYRRGPDDGQEFFENLYQCAFLLFCIGDPGDAPAMWAAKHIDFDTGAGFDVEFLLGAGVEETLRYLSANGYDDIADKLRAYPNLGADLQEWRASRRSYFYGS